MRARILIWTIVLATILVWLAGCAAPTPPMASAPVRTFKFSLASTEVSSWYKGATRFADLVKQRTNGRYGISLFPNASLASGDQVREVQMLREGSIDFAYIGSGRLDAVDPRFAVIPLPWLFADNAEVDKSLINGPLGQELLKIGEPQGIVGLAWGENGYRQITNSKREVKTPDDMKGLKLRIAGKVYDSTMKALGATTTQLGLPEVYAALQSGTLDGQDNPLDLIVSNKFYEVQKYVTLWNYSYSAILLGANKAAWDSLDAETQKIIRQAAVEATLFQIQENRKVNESQLQFLKDKGMTVTTLTPEQLAAFKARVTSVYTEFEPTIGKDFMNKYVTNRP